MQDRLSAFALFRGRVHDVERRTVGGFARGETSIEGLDLYTRRPLIVEDHLAVAPDTPGIGVEFDRARLQSAHQTPA